MVDGQGQGVVVFLGINKGLVLAGIGDGQGVVAAGNGPYRIRGSINRVISLFVFRAGGLPGIKREGVAGFGHMGDMDKAFRGQDLAQGPVRRAHPPDGVVFG